MVFNPQAGKTRSRRLRTLDLVRGFAVLLMFFHHGLYDLKFLFGVERIPQSLFYPFHLLIVTLFILAASMTAACQRAPSLRGVTRQLAAALLLSFLTSVGYAFGRILPGFILWNILHVLAVARLIDYGLARYFKKREDEEIRALDAAGELYETKPFGAPMAEGAWSTSIVAKPTGCFTLPEPQFSSKARRRLEQLKKMRQLVAYSIVVIVFLIESVIKAMIYRAYEGNLPLLDSLSVLPWLVIYFFFLDYFRGQKIKERLGRFEATHPGGRFSLLAFLGRHALVFYFIHQPVLYLLLKGIHLWRS